VPKMKRIVVATDLGNLFRQQCLKECANTQVISFAALKQKFAKIPVILP